MLRKLLDPRVLAVGRTAVGATMLARPALIPRVLGVEPEAAATMSWAMQMLGAREVALAGGALAGRKQPRLWLAAGLLSDAVDVVAVGAAVRQQRLRVGTGGGLVLLALSAVTIGADALRRS